METVIIAGESRADELLEGFSIVKAREFDVIDSSDAAVIMGVGARAEIRSAMSVVVDGDGRVERLPGHVQLISCGVSGKNTVSVTSRTGEKVTISLNRTVKTKNGECEPLEMPVEAVEGISEFDMMAAFAVKVLLEVRG